MENTTRERGEMDDGTIIGLNTSESRVSCMQLCGQPWRSTTSAPTLFKSPKTSITRPLWCRPLQQQHRRLVLKKVGVRQRYLLSPALFNICLERITTDALEYHKGTVRRRQNNCKPPLCWWHWWLRRRWRRTGKFGWASWQSLHSWQHIDQCQEDQADDKQHQWHQHS